MESEKPIVVITGISGYLGSEVCMAFLKNGTFKVRGTVRDPTNAKKVAPLKESFGELFDQLELVKADLLDAKSLQEALKGATYVVNVASPVVVDASKQTYDNTVLPAVKSVETLCEAAAANGIKTFVQTSSIAACIYQEEPVFNVTPDEWTDLEMCKRVKEFYPIAKTESEKYIWDFQKKMPEDKKFDVVVINPGVIMGPQLNKGDNFGNGYIRSIILGKVPNLPVSTSIVDVRDVAKAHLNAILLPKAANKRYVLTAGSVMGVFLPQTLDPKYGKKSEHKYPIDTSVKGGLGCVKCLACCTGNWGLKTFAKVWGVQIKYDNSATKEYLDIDFIPMEQTLIETADQYHKNGWLAKDHKF